MTNITFLRLTPVIPSLWKWLRTVTHAHQYRMRWSGELVGHDESPSFGTVPACSGDRPMIPSTVAGHERLTQRPISREFLVRIYICEYYSNNFMHLEREPSSATNLLKHWSIHELDGLYSKFVLLRAWKTAIDTLTNDHCCHKPFVVEVILVLSLLLFSQI